MDIWEKTVLLMNLGSFVLMSFDKHQAKRTGCRIPEKLLLTMAIFGGSAGIWLGMKIFRHKTRHAQFYIGIPLIIALQVVLLLIITYRL